MRKTFVIISMLAVTLSSCGSKKLEGKYKAKYKINQIDSVDSKTTDFANALFSKAEISLNFKTDDSVEYGVNVGDVNNQQIYNYHIVGDSLIMKKDNQEESYFIEHKNDTVHLSSKNITLSLTKAE